MCNEGNFWFLCEWSPCHVILQFAFPPIGTEKFRREREKCGAYEANRRKKFIDFRWLKRPTKGMKSKNLCRTLRWSLRRWFVFLFVRLELSWTNEVRKLALICPLAPPLISTSNRLCEDWINRRIPINSCAAKLIRWNHVTGLCCCWRQAVRRLIESLQETLRRLRFHLRKLSVRAGPKMY